MSCKYLADDLSLVHFEGLWSSMDSGPHNGRSKISSTMLSNPQGELCTALLRLVSLTKGWTWSESREPRIETTVLRQVMNLAWTGSQSRLA